MTTSTQESFARLMKLVFQIDPLKCPVCSEQMKIVAFVQTSNEIDKIASNLGFPTWRAQPQFAPRGSFVDSSSKLAQLDTENRFLQ
jgi:hypothetical protein